MTKQREQFGCGYLQTAQEVTESLILNSNHSRIRIAAITQIVSFSRHLCSRRDARVDKPMPKEWLLGKVTSKIQIYCIEQNRKYLHSIVISLLKLTESQSCKEIINNTQRNVVIQCLYFSIFFESRQFFKRIFYLKQMNIITLGLFRAEGPGQLLSFPPPNPALMLTLIIQ